jgi:hypothetical protein
VRAWYRAAVRDAYALEDGPNPLYYNHSGGKWSGAALERLHLRPDFAEVGLAPPEPVEGEAPFAPLEAPAFTPPRPAKPAAVAAALSEAADPATGPERLFALADESRYWEVKYAVVRHHACGRDTLQRLSRRDCPPDLRLLALNHPNVPKSLVKHLAVAMDPLVRRAARRHPLADAAVRAESVSHVRYLLTEHAEPILTLGPRLARMALLAGPDADPNHVMVAAAAGQGASPPSWLDRLAAAFSPHLAPGSPRHVLLEQLADDGNAWVRAAARRRLAEPDWTFGPLW